MRTSILSPGPGEMIDISFLNIWKYYILGENSRNFKHSTYKMLEK